MRKRADKLKRGDVIDLGGIPHMVVGSKKTVEQHPDIPGDGSWVDGSIAYSLEVVVPNPDGSIPTLKEREGMAAAPPWDKAAAAFEPDDEIALVE